RTSPLFPYPTLFRSPLDIVGDRLVELVAADPDRAGHNDAVEGDDGYLGRTAPDVDHHVAARVGHRHLGPDRRRQRLADQVGTPGDRKSTRLNSSHVK